MEGFWTPELSLAEKQFAQEILVLDSRDREVHHRWSVLYSRFLGVAYFKYQIAADRETRCILDEMAWGWNLSLKIKFTCVSCTSDTHSQKGILHSSFIIPVV